MTRMYEALCGVCLGHGACLIEKGVDYLFCLCCENVWRVDVPLKQLAQNAEEILIRLCLCMYRVLQVLCV